MASSVAQSATASSKANKGRLIHVDAIRGALLILMGVNHIPSDLQVVTNHPFGYMSAAEGFVFMSGLMSGWVYSRRYYKDGAAALKEASMRRALAVYLYHVGTFIAVLGSVCLLSYGFGIFPVSAADLMIDHPWATLLSGCVLLQQPALFDILPMYCVFLVALPFLLLACIRGQRKTVLIGSLLIWFLTNVFSPQTPLIRGMINTGSFNLLAWQFVFVLGAICGQAWAAGETFVPRPRGWSLTLVGIFATFFFLIRHAYVHLALPDGWLDWLTNKNNFAPLRLIDTLLIYYLFYALVSRFPKLFAWRPLAFLGRHSIFVFACHIAVAYTILGLPETLNATAGRRWLGTGLMIASLFIAAGIDEWVDARSKARQISARQPGAGARKMGYGTRPLG